MKTSLSLVFGICVLAANLPAQQQALRGFLAGERAEQQKREKAALEIPDPSQLRRYMDFMAAEPHHAGSPRSKAVAQYVQSQLKEWGLQTEIEEFDALLPYPTERIVHVTGPKPFQASLKETAVAEDPDSTDKNQLPTYNAYSASGDVSAEVVYANYGIPEDYEWLAKQNISVKGKIVLTRYGKSWRGIKPKVAAQHGAIGCLIYSDPHDDGYFAGDVYPKGPMRPPQGAQRGSVMDMPLYPGDPLTPGWASVRGAKKLAPSEAKSLLTIPVLPISYEDAKPILEQLTGPLVPADWRGSLPLTYHAGPGATQLHLKTNFDWTNKSVFDVIATIPGSEFPDEWVIIGNHHDAWVNGADDPISGAVAVLETARTLGKLAKDGWRPKRTIKIALWDAEEFGLIGSTEWVEKHADELKTKAVAYLNSDSNGRGWLHVSGSHTLEDFLQEAAQAVTQPGANQDLANYALHHPPSPDADPDETRGDKGTKDFTIGALGAGSDYVAFIDHLGIASTNSAFSGQTKSGIYHSVYDSRYWYSHFSDGTFVYGKALAQFTTIAAMRLADSSILPFDFLRFTKTIETYLDEIGKEAKRRGKQIDLSPVQQQLTRLRNSGNQYEVLFNTALQKPALTKTGLTALNRTLIQTERSLIRPEGLPNREWYKHQIYAPGFYTGYGVKTLPGIREAVDSKDWDLATKQTEVVANTLDAFNAVVEQALGQLQGL